MFVAKRMKDSLSSFLPNLPGVVDNPGTEDNSSLRGLIEKPPGNWTLFTPRFVPLHSRVTFRNVFNWFQSEERSFIRWATPNWLVSGFILALSQISIGCRCKFKPKRKRSRRRASIGARVGQAAGQKRLCIMVSIDCSCKPIRMVPALPTHSEQFWFFSVQFHLQSPYN